VRLRDQVEPLGLDEDQVGLDHVHLGKHHVERSGEDQARRLLVDERREETHLMSDYFSISLSLT